MTDQMKKLLAASGQTAAAVGDMTQAAHEGETRIIGGEEVTVYPDHQWQPAARVGKARAGRLLDGREWNEVPEAGKCP